MDRQQVDNAGGGNAAPGTVPGLPRLYIDACQCIGCAVCADVCSYQAMRMEVLQPLPEWDESACVRCGECQEQCPTAAIILSLDCA